MPLEADRLAAAVGTEIGCSRWIDIGQERINHFANVTEDWQAIHLDEKAGKQAGFDGPVAHGFLILSMMSAMAYDALPQIEGQKTSINYGFDKLRFITPVLAGDAVRARFLLDAVEARDAHALMLCLAVTVEIKDRPKPALSALWRIIYTF
ncbi:MaoC family dehydratase [uncultured Roseobacter sp.]|uniref:MaoC family dehydratase n=1 Tax=uncultured Roseobacter sp. TaxID=114847 RepID=UPI00262EE728|nr:MaoC family dehydratase [uncultured Roseobacter sp.]